MTQEHSEVWTADQTPDYGILLMGGFEVAHFNASAPLLEAVNALNSHDDLVKALEGLLELCQRATPDAFKNGVTDSMGQIDEGDVWASGFLDAARIALLKAKAVSA